MGADTGRPLLTVFGLPHPSTEAFFDLVSAIVEAGSNGAWGCRLVTDPGEPLSGAMLYLRSEALDGVALLGAAMAGSLARQAALLSLAERAEASWGWLVRVTLEDVLHHEPLALESVAEACALSLDNAAIKLLHRAFLRFQVRALPYDHPYRYLSAVAVEPASVAVREEADPAPTLAAAGFVPAAVRLGALSRSLAIPASPRPQPMLLIVADTAGALPALSLSDPGRQPMAVLSLDDVQLSTDAEDTRWRPRRDPEAAFDHMRYLRSYPDVAAARVDPVVHYDSFGHREGRFAYRLPLPIARFLHRSTGTGEGLPDLSAVQLGHLHLHQVDGHPLLDRVLPWAARQLAPDAWISGGEETHAALTRVTRLLAPHLPRLTTFRMGEQAWRAVPAAGAA